MAHSETNADAAVRAYLLAEVKDFRRLMVDTMLGDSTESAQFTWDALSGRVDAIAAGKSVTLSRYELPDGHPLATAGHPSDSLELGEDNVVRPSDQDHLFGIRGHTGRPVIVAQRRSEPVVLRCSGPGLREAC